ncbi:MAG: carbon-nitrogen hydrolase family protein, partial [Armatimonadetes bacterium]|nr:carbon-nitrogen hydrolase family protein [Armatimonadota bacterium]
MSSSAVGWAVCLLAISSGLTLADEVVFQEDFTHRPAAEPVFTKTYGDEPKSVDQNAVTADEGEDGKPGAALRLTFAGKGEHSLSYWVYTLAEPLPLVDGLTRIEVRLRTNVRVALKVGMSPYGFIYHAGGVPAADGWQTLAMDRVAGELHDWVRRGQRDPRLGYVSSIILAIQDTSDTSADIRVARVTILAADGTRAALADEVLRRRAACVRLAAMSMLWSDEERTLSKVLEWLGIAKHMGADLAVLPQECVAGPGEPIPGPTSQAIAARAKQLGIWVVGNLRETADGRTYVTSFLVNRAGEVVGTYRKSHKLPDEDMDLGDALPVFRTELGTIAMKIGTDRHFAEIDHCYAVQGAQILCWSQRPEPLEDEQLQDRPVPGMATDYGMTYVCSRYASAKPGWITNMYPTYPGRPIGRAFVVDANGSRVASTRHTGGGVALATIPVGRLGFGRPRPSVSGFKLLGQPNTVPRRPAYAKRVIRVGMIDSGVPIRTLLERLDACGREGCDIVCTYEMVWIAVGP